jgi:hypothetical protein
LKHKFYVLFVVYISFTKNHDYVLSLSYNGIFQK